MVSRAAAPAVVPAVVPVAPPAQPASRIVPAQALRGVASFAMGELASNPNAPARRLTARDLDNETARAAFALGQRRGYELGARAGLEQGYSEGSQALEEFESRKAADVAGQMQQLAENFRVQMAALESQVASDLVSLAIDIARQVLRREPATDPAALQPAAAEALRALGDGASQIELRLNPADAEVLQGQLGNTVTLHADAAMARGNCRVEADTGIADAGFESRWQAVMAALGRDEEPLP